MTKAEGAKLLDELQQAQDAAHADFVKQSKVKTKLSGRKPEKVK